MERLAGDLESQLDGLLDAVMLRVRRVDPGPSAGGALNARRWGPIEELTRSALRAELRGFRTGLLPERCPDQLAASISGQARAGAMQLLLASCRVAQATLWEAWFALIEDSAELLGAGRRDLLQRGSDFFFDFGSMQCQAIATACQEALRSPLPPAEERRWRTIEAILDGERSAAASLGFDLERHHLGLITWGDDPHASAKELASGLRRPLLTVAPPDEGQSCWAWISGIRPLAPKEQRLLRSFAPRGGGIALGLEASGLDGFRATHRQAQRARRFAPDEGPALMRYEDVAVEALVCENEDDARAFVEFELHGIEDDSETSRRLRQTLQVYFASESNAASAAATLGVHQQTVANRLRAAEERLGHQSIGARRVELEMALRLRSSLDLDRAG